MWGIKHPGHPDARRPLHDRGPLPRARRSLSSAPDYADNTKFADEWLAAQPGTDGALAMAMGHVILRSSSWTAQVPRFEDYVKRFTDLPFLVTLRERPATERYVPDRFLTAADLGGVTGRSAEGDAWKTVASGRARRGRPCVPNGSLGFRHTATGGLVEPGPR